MERLLERCAGLDVHKDSVTACVLYPAESGESRSETQTFRTTTASLFALRDWLAAWGVKAVAMESTGVYWKPVYYMLEDEVDCWLVNARHLHNVPGRKTDKADANWIAQLLQHGLVRRSLVPPPAIRELREVTRYRKSLVYERTRQAQRLDKVLQDAGIKLSSVASDILGVSGRSMLIALVQGTSDPEVLADLALGKLRSKIPALQEALEGRFQGYHRLLVREILDHVAYLDGAIARLTSEVEGLTSPFEEEVALLDTIPGVERRVAEVIISETGGDMTRFPSAAHLASWAGMCPGNNESAGKRRSGKTRKGSKWLRTTLVEAANAAVRKKDSCLAARYRRLKPRLGHKKAVFAIAHSILVIAYHILTRRQPFDEQRLPPLNDPQAAAHRIQRLVRQLQQLGQEVILNPAAA